MKGRPKWLPLLFWLVTACAPTSDQLLDINLPTVVVSPASTAMPVPAVNVTPTPAPVTDKLAFASTRALNDTSDIYLMNSDGSGLARLNPAGVGTLSGVLWGMLFGLLFFIPFHQFAPGTG